MFCFLFLTVFFSLGVDDRASECDLDGMTEWNWMIINNGDEDQLEKSIKLLIEDLESVLN